MLQFHKFSYALGGSNILENINFFLPAGAYLSIIGPNGAGKSTLLKCLLRLNDDGLTEGEIRLKGRELSSYKQRELARLLAYVPQAGGWIPPYTVKEFLLLSRYPYSSLSSAWQKSDLAAVEHALATPAVAEARPLPRRSPRADEPVAVLTSSGHSLLDRAGVDALKKWRFSPARKNGEAEITVEFRLE